MFKIFTTVCFLAVGVEEQNLCMQGYLPLTKPIISAESCSKSVNEIAEYIDEDFKQRKISIYFECRRDTYGTTNT
mgnify:CR=1 FL=1